MYKFYETSFRNQTLSLTEKFFNLSFMYILFIMLLASIGVVMLYWAADGGWSPWALNHLVRFAFGFVLMLALAMTDIRVFTRYAYIFYFGSLILLIIVEVEGYVGMVRNAGLI